MKSIVHGCTKTNLEILREITRTSTISSRALNALTQDIRQNGIKEPIEYVFHDGEKYIVGGHHRVFIAEKLGIAEVPVTQVELPYKGYRSVDDLKWSPF